MSDSKYLHDETALGALKAAKAWTNKPKFFNTVSYSPAAVMKIMTHCHSGVQNGIREGGKPIEVMGLMSGRMDTEVEGGIVITNAYPLPITGFETRVIADDSDTVNFMINLSESLEGKDEHICGWYHSHPFDLGPLTHSYFSSTDLSTQLSWQRSEDPHGNPWVGAVVDPLRSLSRRELCMKTFRAYPPEYSSPVTHECPDGSVVKKEQERLEKWGTCWNRYYELASKFHMSNLAHGILSSLNKNEAWINTLTKKKATDDAEVDKSATERIGDIALKLLPTESKGSEQSAVGGDAHFFDKAVKSLEGMAVDACEGVMTSNTRRNIFSCGDGKGEGVQAMDE